MDKLEKENFEIKKKLLEMEKKMILVESKINQKQIIKEDDLKGM